MAPPRTIYVRPWRIDISVRDGVRSPLPGSVLARTAARALSRAGAPAPGRVGIVLTDDAEIAQLNARHMGADGPTDVLSFPLKASAAFPLHPGQRAAAPAAALPQFVVPASLRDHLGDVVISVERATEQANDGRGGQTGDVRWSPADELRLLVTHGMLHLCGWDHAEADEEHAMRALENELMEHE